MYESNVARHITGWEINMGAKEELGVKEVNFKVFFK